jgi:hypothetical protein
MYSDFAALTKPIWIVSAKRTVQWRFPGAMCASVAQAWDRDVVRRWQHGLAVVLEQS